MTSKTTVAPFYRIKILFQTHNTHYKNFGVFTGLKAILEKESFRGLYRENGAMMLVKCNYLNKKSCPYEIFLYCDQICVFPYSAIQYMSFEVYKKSLFGKNDKMIGKINHGLKFIAGSCGGITSVVTAYPLDLTRA